MRRNYGLPGATWYQAARARGGPLPVAAVGAVEGGRIARPAFLVQGSFSNAVEHIFRFSRGAGKDGPEFVDFGPLPGPT